MAHGSARPLLHGLICVGALFNTALGGWFSSDPAVVALGPDSFDDHIKKNKWTFLEIYAPWCGHCKELAPKYDAVAKSFQGKGVSFAKIDAEEHKDFAKATFKYEGLPTLLWFEEGKKTDYNGQRTVEDLTRFVKLQTRPAVIEGEEPETPEKVPSVVLHAPALTKGFKKAAEALREKGVFYFVKDMRGKPRMVTQHKNEEPIEVELAADADEDAVTAAFEPSSLPLFGLLDTETFARYEGRGLIWTLIPVNKRAGATLADMERENRPMMTKVAKKVAAESYSIVFTDTELYREQIYNMLGVKRMPAVVVQPRAGSQKKYAYSDEMTEAAIMKFVEDAIAGKVDAVVKSEPPPASNSGSIKVFVGTTIQEEAFRPDRDVLVEFYAPWCGACKALEPEYKKLGQYVKQWELEDVVTIAKMDATANDVPESMKVEAFPTLYFVPAGSSEPVKFDGSERNSKGIWQWIKQHSAKSEEIKSTQARVRAKKKEL